MSCASSWPRWSSSTARSSPGPTLSSSASRLQSSDPAEATADDTSWLAHPRWCSIVAWWIENHPRDFAAPGTKAAFDDLYDAIEDRPHLCHFGDKFLPFAYHLDELVPEELPWAVPDVDDELSPGPGHAALNTTEETPAGVLISTTTTVSYGPSSSTSVDNLQRTSQSAQRSTSSIASGSRPSSVPLRDRHDSETSRRSAGSMGNSSAAPSSIDKPLAQTASNGSGSAQTSAISAPSLGPSGLADVWESRAVSRLVSRFNELPDLQIASDITRLVWRYFERVEVSIEKTLAASRLPDTKGKTALISPRSLETCSLTSLAVAAMATTRPSAGRCATSTTSRPSLTTSRTCAF
jgi:hypothetical protein